MGLQGSGMCCCPAPIFCALALLPSKTGQWESRVLGVTKVVVGKWGLCPALPQGSWDKRVPVRILLGPSENPPWETELPLPYQQQEHSAFPNIHTMTLQEVPDHIVAILQDVFPAPTQGHIVPKGTTSAAPTPCPAPPWAGAPAQNPPNLPPSPHSSSPAALQESSSLYCSGRRQHSGHLQQSLLRAVTPNSPPPGPCAL